MSKERGVAAVVVAVGLRAVREAMVLVGGGSLRGRELAAEEGGK